MAATQNEIRTDDLWQVARELHEGGLSTIPVAQGEKRPLIANWTRYCQSAPRQDELRAWESQYPSANIGCALGKGVGRVAIDVDDPKSFEQLCVDRELPPTQVVITPGRGRHIHFAYPEGADLSNARVRLAEGVELRRDGQQVLLPPSVHPNGGVYAWAEGCSPNEIELAALPDWILDLCIRADGVTNPEAPPLPDGLPPLLDVLIAHGAQIPRRVWDYLNGPSPPVGKRSDALWHFSNLLFETGLTREEVFVLARHSPLDKFSQDCRQDEDLWRDICRAAGQAKSNRSPEEAAREDLLNLVRPLREVRERALENPPEPLSSGLLYRGMLHLLAGPPKAGKTTFWNWLVSQLTRAETKDILTRPARGGLRVLVVTEEHGFSLAEGLAKADLDRIDVITTSDYRRLSTAQKQELLQAITSLAEERYPDLIVIDTLQKAYPIEDENSNAELMGILEPLATLAHTSGIAVLIVSQHRKSGGRHGQEIRGASDLFGAVDIYWAVRRDPPCSANERTVEVIGRSVGCEQPLLSEPIVIQWDGANYHLSERKTDMRRRVAGLAYDHGEVTPKTIADTLSIPKSSAGALLKQMLEDGDLEQSSDRKPYVLTPKGKRYLPELRVATGDLEPRG